MLQHDVVIGSVDVTAAEAVQEVLAEEGQACRLRYRDPNTFDLVAPEVRTAEKLKKLRVLVRGFNAGVKAHERPRRIAIHDVSGGK